MYVFVTKVVIVSTPFDEAVVVCLYTNPIVLCLKSDDFQICFLYRVDSDTKNTGSSDNKHSMKFEAASEN